MRENHQKVEKDLERFWSYYERLKACRVLGRKKNWYKQELIQATEGMLASLERIKHNEIPRDDTDDVMKLTEVFGKTLENYLDKNE